MPFPLMALGAGLGQGVEAIQQQQQNALRQQMMQMQMQNYARQQQEQMQRQQALGIALKGFASGGLGPGGMQPLSPMPTAGGPDMGGGVRAGGALTGGSDPRGLSPYIQETATRYGIDPNVAMKVFGSEGLGNPVGDRGTSFGAPQLHVGGGLGDVFQKETGLDPRNWQQNERQMIDWSLKRVASNPTEGWTPYHGAARVGIGPRQGIGAAPQQQPAAVEAPAAQSAQAAVAPDAGASEGSGAPVAPEQHLQQQVRQGVQQVAQITPQQVYGRMSVNALAKQVQQIAPDADPVVQFMILEEAQKLLAPDAKMQWEMFKQQHDESFQKEMATYRHNLTLDKAGTWDVKTDPVTGEQYRYNATIPQATTLTGQPYTPQGAQRLGGAGASPLSGDRAADLKTETTRLDAAWATEHPLATEDEKKAAHFQNRAKAEKVMAEAKTSSARQSPRTMIFRKAMEEHPDLTPEEMQTYLNNQDLNAKITATFASGDAAKQMRAVNTVADHILRVQDYAEALRNGQIPRANQLANATAKELGRPEVTTFEAGRDIMADEVVRLLTSTGGTEKDREGMQSRISAMMSPEQFAGVFGAFRDFSGARFEALRQQYSHNDPKREAEFSQFLTPAARKVFEGMKPPGALRQEGAAPGAPAAPAAAAPDGRRAYKPGEVVEKGGKKYRVTGGDPYNPDVEEVK